MPEMLDLDAIEARARAVIDDEASEAALDLSAAIDCFDATAVDDMLLLIAEVRRLREIISNVRAHLNLPRYYVMHEVVDDIKEILDA